AQDHTVALEFSTRQGDHFASRLIKIDQLAGPILLAKERTQSRNHVSRAMSIANGAARGFTRAVDVWRISVQHTHARTRVRDNARQRLIDFVRDRSCQSSETHGSRYVREL